MNIRKLSTTSASFEQDFDILLSRTDEPDSQVVSSVQEIICNIRERGDEALLEYTNKFDQRNATLQELEISLNELKQAEQKISRELHEALQTAAQRIRDYHQKQVQTSWTETDSLGNVLGQHVTSLDRAGVYVPGGKAAYPSSVLMNVIPAKVAGVEEVIMVVPFPRGEKNLLVLAAASIAGVDRLFSIGGAQAVAALAYGTASVPRVDKITGPGNIYVATAKRLVFGAVGIDMIAGPSEVVIIADQSADPDWLAMDLFAQAEHDEQASSILITDDEKLVAAVSDSIEKLLPQMERADIIGVALKNNGALIQTRNQQESIDIANRIAPEHLELAVSDPDALLPSIRNAGAIFMGHFSAEVLGDYCAGPNHVLPTARTARFSSPLGVYDFQKRSSIIQCNPGSVDKLARVSSTLARGEGLTAHARSAEYRLK